MLLYGPTMGKHVGHYKGIRLTTIHKYVDLGNYQAFAAFLQQNLEKEGHQNVKKQKRFLKNQPVLQIRIRIPLSNSILIDLHH